MRSQQIVPTKKTAEPEEAPFDYLRLIRRHWAPTLFLTVVGAVLSLAALLWQKPVYQASALLEIDSLSASYRNSSVEPVDRGSASDGSDMMTESRLLVDGPVIKRVVGKMSEDLTRWPAPPPDALSGLRAKLRGSENPRRSLQTSIGIAAGTFKARPVNGTRLMEISCESTNPAIAAAFLNSIADEFIGETARSRAEAAQQTTEWLIGRLNAEKDKLKAAEERLRSFLQHSGEFYGSPESTMDDPKLKQLQSSLATAQAERIRAQARYETAVKSKAGAVPEINQDPAVQSLRAKLQDTEEQKSSLSSFTSNYPKLKHVEESEVELRKALDDRVQLIVEQLRDEYNSAVRQEDLLRQAYLAQGSEVAARAGVAADYVTLSRDVDNYRSIYDSLLKQVNQSQIGESLPTTLVQLVQPCETPSMPYKPKLGSMLALGIMGGMGAGIGLAFLKEKKDGSVKAPGIVRTILSVPELGVIPSMDAVHAAMPKNRSNPLSLHTGIEPLLLPPMEGNAVAQAAWSNSAPILAESFRKTLTSLKREAARTSGAKSILVTSAQSGDGKTTMVTNLGIALAETGARVALVDADFRRYRLGAAFVMEEVKGLSELIESTQSVESFRAEELAKPTGIPNLYLLPCGKPSGNISKLCYSPRLRAIVQRLGSSFDFVLYDAPPLLPLADSRLIAQFVDGVVLIVRAGSTDKSTLQAVHLSLAEDGIPVLGTILNGWSPSRAELRNQYSYYM